MALTKKQRQLLDYIESFSNTHGYAPSYEEIAQALAYSSLAAVHEHLTNLEQKGVLRKNSHQRRSLEVVRTDPGSIAMEHEEAVTVPPDMIRSGNNYVLRIKGESMIDEQIRDGDYIVVNSCQTAENGEMVVALVDGEAATVKKYYREGAQVRLQPANPTMQAMYYPAERVTIQGIVVGVIRKLDHR